MRKSMRGVVGGAIVAALTGWAAAGQAQTCPSDLPLVAKGKLTMSINATSPPTQYVDEGGKFQGVNIDLGNEVAKRLCLEPSYVNIAFEAQIPGLQNGRWDMIDTSMYFTAERAKIMYLIPYGVQALAIVAPPGNPAKVAGMKDLAGHVIGVEIGGFEEKNLRDLNTQQIKDGLKPMDIRVFNTYGDTYQALQAGQVEAVFAGDAVGRYYQEKGRFTMAATGLFPGTAQALATANPKLADAVADGLNGMLKDGTFAKIMDKWGATKADQWSQWTGAFKAFHTP